jgi:hypothetical protein
MSDVNSTDVFELAVTCFILLINEFVAWIFEFDFERLCFGLDSSLPLSLFHSTLANLLLLRTLFFSRFARIDFLSLRSHVVSLAPLARTPSLLAHQLQDIMKCFIP